jgi:hypothetical protein
MWFIRFMVRVYASDLRKKLTKLGKYILLNENIILVL